MDAMKSHELLQQKQVENNFFKAHLMELDNSNEVSLAPVKRSKSSSPQKARRDSK